MAQSLFSTYTNLGTGRTAVMHGAKLCGYVEKVLDEERRVWPRGFYYAVSVAKGGEVVPSYCMDDSFAANVAHVQREWAAAR